MSPRTPTTPPPPPEGPPEGPYFPCSLPRFGVPPPPRGGQKPLSDPPPSQKPPLTAPPRQAPPAKPPPKPPANSQWGGGGLVGVRSRGVPPPSCAVAVAPASRSASVPMPRPFAVDCGPPVKRGYAFASCTGANRKYGGTCSPTCAVGAAAHSPTAVCRADGSWHYGGWCGMFPCPCAAPGVTVVVLY